MVFQQKNSTLVNLFDEPNYYNEKKILKRIETLNKYTQTTNFHFINSIRYKDNLHRLYKKMNKKFPVIIIICKKLIYYQKIKKLFKKNLLIILYLR